MVNILEEVSGYVTVLLKKAIPAKMYFHHLSHTQAVVEAVKIIGTYENVSSQEMEVLQVAAWFHDTGYIKTYNGHEEVSKSIAENFLISLQYDQNNIKKVLAGIQATVMPQNPQNHLEKILCDADFYHLSQSDYWKKNKLLKKELEHYFKTHYSDKEWFFQNLNFLREHHYFTGYGQAFLEAKKKQHLDENVKILEKLNEK